MKKTYLSIIKLFCFLIIPILISFSFFTYITFHSSHSTNGTTSLISHKGQVITIHRDSYSIPHIQAKTLSDTLYGLGHVHAQDRLWSMHIRRIIISGRLSELFGPDCIIMDKYMLNLGFRYIAQESMKYLDSEVKGLLEAYTNGINDYIKSLTVLPLEFLLTQAGLRYLEPFSIVDCIALAKYTGWILAEDWPFELLRDDLIDVIGKELLDEVMPYEYQKMYSKAVILNDQDAKEAGMYEEYNTSVEGFEAKEKSDVDRACLENSKRVGIHQGPIGLSREILSFTKQWTSSRGRDGGGVGGGGVGGGGGGKGSNCWIIGGNHTQSGKPLLSNDPHLDNSMPSVWYQAELIYANNMSIIGGTMPGLPFIILGRTKDFAFGLTTLEGDTTDLYNETISEDGLSYYYNGEWIDLNIRKERIYVKGKEDPIIYQVKSTRHGPILDVVINELMMFGCGPLIKKMNYSLGWVGYIINDTSFYGWFEVMKAKNYNELMNGLEYVIIPSVNYLFAFDNGDFGYAAIGKIPKRNKVENGCFVQDGTTSSNDWLGFYSLYDNPHILNPTKGYIIAANNKFTTDNYKNHVALTTSTTARADRIEQIILEKLSQGIKFNTQDMMDIQLDIVDIYAQDTMKKLIALVQRYKVEYYKIRLGMISKKALLLKEMNNVEEMIDRLKEWDYRVDVDSISATIYAMWEYLYTMKTFRLYEMSEEVRNALYTYYHYQQFIYKNIHKWHNDEVDGPNSKLDAYLGHMYICVLSDYAYGCECI